MSVSPAVSNAPAANGKVATVDRRAIFSPTLVWGMAIGYFVTGLASQMITKMQNRRQTAVCGEADCSVEGFNQPFWQTLVMFGGEALLIIIYFVDKKIARGKGQDHGITEFPTEADLSKPRITPAWFAITSFIDLVASSLLNIAMVMTYASTVVMLRNCALLVTAFLSMILLHRPLRRCEWYGMVIMTLGMIVTAISSIINPDTSSLDNPDLAWVGIVVAIVGTVGNAAHSVVQEKILTKGYIPPLAAQGTEGLFGIVFTVITIIICHYAGWYNFAHGWYQMHHDAVILTGNILYLIAVSGFNACGILLTVVSSAVLRTVVKTSRAPFVWILELILGWQGFSFYQFASLILTTVGFMIYSYLIPFVSKAKDNKFRLHMRKHVDMCCTYPLPPSDVESEDDAEEAKVVVDTV